MTSAKVALVGSLIVLTACGNTDARTGTAVPSVIVTTAASSVRPDPTPSQAPYLVPAPILVAPAGPGPAEHHRPCLISDVNATAVTRPIVGGVAGVAHLDGTGCSLHITAGQSGLLDATGRQLPVRLDNSVPSVNPPLIPRNDIPLGAGYASWGFTWNGSWCGATAATVVIALTGDPDEPDAAGPFGDLHVPLTGPQPSCSGESRSVLRPGVAGDPGDSAVAADAVLPSPADWAGLRASLTLPPTSTAGLVFTLHNQTGTPIVLSPCPMFDVVVRTEHSSVQGTRVLDCHSHDTVPAHGEASFALPQQDYGQGEPSGLMASGSLVTVEVAIAGVPTAIATAHAG